MNHFLTAVATATLTFILIQATLKIDKVSWKQLGQGTLKKNIFSFFLGLLIWVIPAFIGTIISLMFGLVEIKIHSDLNYLLFSIFILFHCIFDRSIT